MSNDIHRNIDLSNSIAPDGGWGWIIVFSSFMIHFIMDGITYSMGDIYLEPMLLKIHSGRGYVSAIFSLLESVTLATAPISTVFTNTFGSRAITIVGAGLASIGFFLSRWWTNIYYYYLTIGLIAGIGCGLMYLPAIVSVGYYFERKRSFAMGIAVCGSGLGTFVFPFIMPYLINWLFNNDYKGALLIESASIFLCVFFGLLMVPLPIEPSEQRRIRIKLQKETKRQINKINENNKQTNQSQIEYESVPFLTQTINNASNEKESTIDERRNTSPSFLNDQYIVSNNNKSVLRWKSLTQLSSSYSDSMRAIQSNALYKGSLQRVSRSHTMGDEKYLYNKYNQSIGINNDLHLKTIINDKKESESILRQLIEQINLKLLRSASFSLFILSNFLSSLGFFVPYNFAHDLAKDSNVNEDHRKFVLMAIGISNCFGHVIIGYLADRTWVNRLSLYNSTLIIAGIATVVAPYSGSNILFHVIYASFFGFFSGGYVGLTSIITVDLVGLDKLSNGMGIILLFQGVATAIGTPVAGVIRDLCEKHSRPFILPYSIFGSILALSGAILFAIPLLKQKEINNTNLSKEKFDMNIISTLNENPSSHE